MMPPFSGNPMKTLRGFPAAFFLVLLTAGQACRKSDKATVAVANVAQDTMLLRDLAEANRNTAAAAVMDNSLNTVRTSADGAVAAVAAEPGQSRTPESHVVDRSPRTPGQVLTSGARSAIQPRLNDSSVSKGVGGAGKGTPSGSRASSSGDPCDSRAPLDQRSCLNRSIVQNDADLNRVYQDLIKQSRKSGGPELEERLRESQREWINTRDSECLRQTGGQGGALWARPRARCLADYSARRTAELQRNLNSLRGQ